MLHNSLSDKDFVGFSRMFIYDDHTKL